MNHTNSYYGGKYSFDSGHAYASGSGEGAKIKKFIGSLAHRNNKVAYILRIKDRAQYRVQAGAFSDIQKYNEQVALMRKKGFPAVLIQEDGMFKVQAGLYSGKTNAERLVGALAKKGIASFIKEV
jgi:cell division protein FtsN